MNNNNKIIHGDAAEKLEQLDDESIDLICTDPPYGYSFMNKDWDKAVVSVETWKECIRVMKSGAFAFIMSSPRQDVLCKMILNLIDAGFETNFTSMYHTYASGFPKAANTSKLLKKRGIDKPELEGSYLGFQPKPALEVILVVMKPLSEKSFVDQALKNGKGISWLDDVRIPFQNENDIEKTNNKFKSWGNSKGVPLSPEKGWNQNNMIKRTEYDFSKGRFPANLLVSDDSLNDGKIRKSGFRTPATQETINKIHDGYKRKNKSMYVTKEELYQYNDSGSYSRYFSLDAWWEQQEQQRAQFIITPKASASERNKGLENEPIRKRQGVRPNHPDSTGKFPCCDFRETKNNHPTVKPLKLMSYLITMGSRPNDIILDPFCGSGTTLIAAHQLHRRYIGIELQKEYVDIANKRLEPYLAEGKITDF